MNIGLRSTVDTLPTEPIVIIIIHTASILITYRIIMGMRSITSSAASTSRFSSLLQPAMVLLVILHLQFTGFVVSTSPSYPSELDPHRVAEGEATTLGQYPWVLSLGLTFWGNVHHLHNCAGFILTETWAITTARCVEVVLDVSHFYWLAGTNNLRDGGSQYPLRQIIVHPGYNPNDSYIHDIALVQVTRPFEFSGLIQPIELSTATLEATSGTPGVVVGWGEASQFLVQPNILRSANVTIIDVETCREIYAPWDTEIFGEYQFCAITAAEDLTAKKEHILKTEEGKIERSLVHLQDRSACRGDEGGPFFPIGSSHPSRALGFVSWTFGCIPHGYPSVYTKLSGYYDWISQITGYWII